MHSLRLKKIEEAYHHELAQLLLLEVKDPRLSGISITHVDITPNLHLARIYFVMRGEEENFNEIMKGFRKSKGFLRRELGHRIRLRTTPELEFHLDEMFAQNARIEELFAQLEKEKVQKILP